MIAHREGVRSPTVCCADPRCSALCWDLPREARADHSSWRGGIHCGAIPLITEICRPDEGVALFSSHTGPDLPPSLQLQLAPPVPDRLFGPNCSRRCWLSCPHTGDLAEVDPALRDRVAWGRRFSLRRDYARGIFGRLHPPTGAPAPAELQDVRRQLDWDLANF